MDTVDFARRPKTPIFVSISGSALWYQATPKVYIFGRGHYTSPDEKTSGNTKSLRFRQWNIQYIHCTVPSSVGRIFTDAGYQSVGVRISVHPRGSRCSCLLQPLCFQPPWFQLATQGRSTQLKWVCWLKYFLCSAAVSNLEFGCEKWFHFCVDYLIDNASNATPL